MQVKKPKTDRGRLTKKKKKGSKKVRDWSGEARRYKNPTNKQDLKKKKKCHDKILYFQLRLCIYASTGSGPTCKTKTKKKKTKQTNKQ